ncbi:putative acetyltransferase [Sphingomonas changbaiensis NBRC 104936]|uniref:Putative acetyltransferase n=1 Tax=Sphingomonas changbaiensis NBRC 104936 TaxID=1219043 RepID=A0A0E9MN45_9SPHN|nr:GNAT family N-acetyltransferase [Sphingomonas changbaiensis]GAO38913.1 putative acetyltransferase [Sphingomonas changbaiensis NBRC 104936]
MRIRSATDADWPKIWLILEPVIRAGEAYALPVDMDEADARAYWFAPGHDVFVAEIEDARLAGTYYMRPNQRGGGSHVCNCGYATATDMQGRGIARTMGEHSLETARDRGYRAMQFNFVVASNERAVRLWSSLGFDIVGRLPSAFRHPALGDVDALVMWRSLELGD